MKIEGIIFQKKQLSSIKVDKYTRQKSAYEIENVSEVNLEELETNNPDYEFHTMKFVLYSTGDMQVFNNENDFINYVKDNSTSANVVMEFYLDGYKINDVVVTNGEFLSFSQLNSTPPVKYPCTYQGIRKCVDEGIHSQNWFQMIKCISEGVGCVLDWYINCTIDNCPTKVKTVIQ